MSDDFGLTSGAAVNERDGGRDLVGAARRLLEDAFNSGDFTMVDELIARDAIQHDPNMSRRLREIRGPEPFKQMVSAYRAAFPDVRIVVDDAVAQGDSAWRYSTRTRPGPASWNSSPAGTHPSRS